MNFFLKKIFITLPLLSVVSHLHGYKYPFFNRTDKPIATAIQFPGENEPLYRKLIQPRSKETFEEGKFEIPTIKSGFCLKNIYYVCDPTSAQKKNKLESAPWKAAKITWLPRAIYNTIIESFNKKPSKQQNATTPNTSPSIKELIKPNKQKIMPSLCQDQPFDIVKNEDGKIYFIAPTE